MRFEHAPRARVFALCIAAVCFGCGGTSAKPGVATPAPRAKAAAKAPTSAFATTPHQQPDLCPAPLTWEDGTRIESSELCPDEPAFYFYEGVCCRYQNGCLAPEGAAIQPSREECEKVRQTVEQRAARKPVCKAGELVWQPSFCVFASCERGQFVTPQRDYADCQRPIGVGLSFELDRATPTTDDVARLENMAAMAEVLGVEKLRVEGEQSYDEAPAAKSPVPLSLERANAVRQVLSRATRIPVEVVDAGTAGRARGSPSIFRRVAVSIAPLDDARPTAKITPFTLPWQPCESQAKFRTQIALTKHDGDVLVELCRDADCARGVINAPYWAAWPGSGSELMRGSLKAWLELDATRQQLIRNGANAIGNDGVPGELDGETPASFVLEVSLRGTAVSEGSTYHFRIARRRTEVALDWSGKLAFRRTLRHATRDPEGCLHAELEIPRDGHSLR